MSYTKVTNLWRFSKQRKKWVKGWPINILQYENMKHIPHFLKRDNQFIGIYSGTGRTRVGKSTKAVQDGIFIAWLIAGGEMGENGFVKKYPNKKLKFKLFFDPQELIKAMSEDPAYGVYILDEAREATDSRSQLSFMNKLFSQILTRIAYKNHFLLLVLPDFFSLAKEYATDHSDYLVNCFLNENYEKGYFKFYNRKQKELLYLFGRRLLGNYARYGAANACFDGRFQDYFPFDRKKYNLLKEKAMLDMARREKETSLMNQRDVLVHILKEEKEITTIELSELLRTYWKGFWKADVLEKILQRARKVLKIDPEDKLIEAKPYLDADDLIGPSLNDPKE